MPHSKKLSRTGRPPSGGVAKKVVSLTIDPALIKQVDEYAANKRISRSAAIEAAIVGLLTSNSGSPITQPDCVFASPAVGTAILY
ncbi:MAG: ribbon-helix-helix domain-containing protein [Planctomycetaceae bacterium]|nr:ribbon-helix-helix domain-containing protein [Planctomycetaceae bacterium]